MAEHGGMRQGQPGAAYANRTDLAVNRAPVAGGAPPAPPAAGLPGQRPTSAPEDTPFLTTPGDPRIPMTQGIPTGPGSGAPQPAKTDLDIIRRYLPDMKAAAQAEDAPETFKALVRYLEGSGG
jgi:hypothetical protein